ncbi:MAG: protein phosphatase 2C domain-containing protein [Anaerolineae bacterium]|nr:protein phosphatase 2C domain-containing protein [Anaerolineae bacterium]MCO5205587.1 protein phosphatase 2C domain-containing protein [Anaerolineae bacterium]
MGNGQMLYEGMTHQGVVREWNEDNVYVPQGVDAAQLQTRGYLYIVADGVGGSQGGKRASDLAVSLIPGYYYSDNSAVDVATGLTNAMMSAGRTIVNEANTTPAYHNMGCTVVAAVVKDGVATIAHLGDARAYRLRQGVLQRITNDHSWVQEQVIKGTLTEEEAASHPNRNVITRSLGDAQFPQPDVTTINFHTGDRLLLCSDGLCGVATRDEMQAVLNQNPRPRQAAEALVQVALAKGGPDNIAVVVGQEGVPKAMAAVPPTRRLVPFALIAVIGLILIAFVFLRPSDSSGTAQPATSVDGTSILTTLTPLITVPEEIEPTATIRTQVTPSSNGTSTESITETVEQNVENPGETDTPNSGAPIDAPTPRPPATATPKPPPSVQAIELKSPGLKFREGEQIKFEWVWNAIGEDAKFVILIDDRGVTDVRGNNNHISADGWEYRWDGLLAQGEHTWLIELNEGNAVVARSKIGTLTILPSVSGGGSSCDLDDPTADCDGDGVLNGSDNCREDDRNEDGNGCPNAP